MNKELIREAAGAVGGVIKLSLELGLSRGAVSNWQAVPPEHVLRFEELTGYSRYVVRPDIYGPAPIKRKTRNTKA